MTDIFVICGEKSGDILGAKILKNITNKQIIGVIGPEMRKLNISEILPMEKFELIGFGDIILSIPHIMSIFKKTKQTILKTNPKIVLLIDYIEFNLLLAKKLRKSGYKGKIVQLVSPTIWAWRKNRKKTLERYFDLLLTIFPFEEELFATSTLETHYIGHPIFDNLKNEILTNDLSHLDGKKIIALFPGSRIKEVKTILKTQLESVKPFSTTFGGDYEITLCVSHEKLLPAIKKIIDKTKLKIILIDPSNRYELMKRADLAIAKLGSVNLELAFFEVPTINVSPIPKFDLFLFMFIFKIYLPHYCITNIIAKRRIFPEYVGMFATTDNIRKEIENFTTNSRIRNLCIEGCKEIKTIITINNLNPINYLLKFL